MDDIDKIKIKRNDIKDTVELRNRYFLSKRVAILKKPLFRSIDGQNELVYLTADPASDGWSVQSVAGMKDIDSAIVCNGNLFIFSLGDARMSIDGINWDRISIPHDFLPRDIVSYHGAYIICGSIIDGGGGNDKGGIYHITAYYGNYMMHIMDRPLVKIFTRKEEYVIENSAGEFIKLRF